ncbi:MAG: hypothetical protein KKC26_08390 [Nanoarchaeota archaeon]|nr:hypothetical protein [Nanoarchaeota archaeon]
MINGVIYLSFIFFIANNKGIIKKGINGVRWRGPKDAPPHQMDKNELYNKNNDDKIDIKILSNLYFLRIKNKPIKENIRIG